MVALFISYSHKDEELRNELETHLALLKRQGVITSWHDRRITAGSDFDQAIRLGVEDSRAFVRRGQAYGQIGDFGRAIDSFSHVLEHNPEHVASWGNRGISYLMLGDYTRAIRDFSCVIRLDPQSSQAYAERGVAYYKVGEYGQALDDFFLDLIARDFSCLCTWKFTFSSLRFNQPG